MWPTMSVAKEISQAEADATWEQLGAVPRDQLEVAIQRTQELGATAFKAKDYKKAYEYYNTVVTGTEYLQQTGPTPNDATYLVNALSNRSACKLGLGDAAGAFKDAREPGVPRRAPRRQSPRLARRPVTAPRRSECVRLRPKWQKAWYRFGRALYDQGKVAEAEAAFAEGIQLDLGNGEMLRWRAKCRKRLDELRVDAMKKKRYATDYSKFAAVEAEADIPDEDANTSYRQTDAPVVDTVEEMHDLMNKKQQAQLDAQAPTDIYFRSDMIFLPQAESPAELQEEGAFAAMAAYLEQSTSLYMPMRAVLSLHQPHLPMYVRCINFVADTLRALDLRGHWVHVGVGSGVPILATASLPRDVADRVTALTAHGSPFLDTMAAHLLHRHGWRDRVELVRKPVEQVLVDESQGTKLEELRRAEEPEALRKPALVLVVDPDLFDEGLLGLRVLPYVRHARRALCIPTPLVVPARARVFAMPVAVTIPKACGFDLGEMDEYRWGPWYEEFDVAGCIQKENGGVTFLGDAVEVFDFDFGADDIDDALPVQAKKKLEFAAKADATFNGVVFWFQLQMVQEGFDESYGNAPDLEGAGGPRPAGALNQALQWVDPVKVKRGQTIRLNASHNSTRIRFEVLAPERLLPAVHRHAISRWHFEMVADETRNRAFYDGIIGAVEEIKRGKLMVPSPKNGRRAPTCEVVDFGTGSGLLALMSVRAGATKVTGFDNQGHVVNVARKLMKHHGYEKQVRIIRKDCRQVVMGKDMANRADLLVMELFDYGFLGEGCLHFVHFAWNNVLKEDALILPKGGRILAMLVQLLPDDVEGFDLSPWAVFRFQSDYYGIDLRNQPHVRLSEPFEVFDFDFSRENWLNTPPEAGGEWHDDVKIVADGKLNAVVFWHEIYVWGDVTIPTGPDDPRTCWYQACQQVEELTLKKDAHLPVRATHQGSRVTFGVDRDGLKDAYDDMRTETPLYDPLWLQIHNRLVEQSGKLEKTMAFNSEARQQATDALVSIAVDPARFGRAGRYIEGSKACQFCWSFFMG